MIAKYDRPISLARRGPVPRLNPVNRIPAIRLIFVV
jgi:hypothetical protein